MNRLQQGKYGTMFTVAALCVAGLFSGAAKAADDPAGVKLFEEKVKNILATSCVRCHGEEKQKGGLRLDTRENLLKGGKDDDKVIKVIEPGDPAKSPIIEAINYKNEDTQMPPMKKNKETGKTESQKLTDEQIKDFTEWVKLGAPYTGGPIAEIKK